MLDTLTPLTSLDQDSIAEFYTEHPYPPPVANLDRARDEWLGEARHRAEFHLFWPDKPYRSDIDILVAGCGTWQAAKYALCNPEASVVGIDVSPTSLDETEKLKSKYDLGNLETSQLSIERVAELDKTFDLIICTGVLHHLEDPDAGLRSLRSVLRHDGAIYLMLYAPYGRAGIYMLQEYCRKLGVGTSVQEIDELATSVEALPDSHPLVALLRRSRDMQNTDSLADALLNPRDRSYSVPELFDLLLNNGLVFGRWRWQAPYLPSCGSIASTPHATRLSAMSDLEKFSAMELWRGTMSTHSLIAYRADRSKGRDGIDFERSDPEEYVPIRLPYTICVTERLPKNTAGVLLNRSHEFHDLVLPINEQEKFIFDSIDGSKSVAAIVDGTGGKIAPATAHKFIAKLWDYDQLVLKTTRR